MRDPFELPSTLLPARNPYAPPEAEVQDRPAIQTGQLAGRGARFAARLLDNVLVAWLGFASVWDGSGGFMTLPGYAGPALLMLMLVQGGLLYARGQTLGKRLMGIKIVRSDGERASLVRIVCLRIAPGNLLLIVPALNVLLWPIFWLVDNLMIFGQTRRCLHDLIADTTVVRV